MWIGAASAATVAQHRTTCDDVIKWIIEYVVLPVLSFEAFHHMNQSISRSNRSRSFRYTIACFALFISAAIDSYDSLLCNTCFDTDIHSYRGKCCESLDMESIAALQTYAKSSEFIDSNPRVIHCVRIEGTSSCQFVNTLLVVSIRGLDHSWIVGLLDCSID